MHTAQFKLAPLFSFTETRLFSFTELVQLYGNPLVQLHGKLLINFYGNSWASKQYGLSKWANELVLRRSIFQGKRWQMLSTLYYSFLRKKCLTMEEIWSNRTYVALALFSLISTCVVFWSHRRRDIGYTAVMFLPERMYITLDSSASTSHPSLKRHKCIWGFGKAFMN